MAEKVVIGNAELWHGDCREVLQTLVADAIVTDPPYGIGFVHSGNDGGVGGLGHGRYKTKFGGVKIAGDDMAFDPSFIKSRGLPTVLWGANHYASRLDDSSAWLCWDKRAASGHTNDFSDCELAWTNRRGVARMFRHHWDGMMRASERGIERQHPTQKPIAVMEWCIQQLGSPAVVCDPYMGVGSTGVAAMNLGLHFIGVEIHRPYFDIACERIERAQRQAPLVPFELAPVPQQQGLGL